MKLHKMMYGEKFITAGEFMKMQNWTKDKRRLHIANGLLRDIAFVLSVEIKNGQIRLKEDHVLEILTERIANISEFLNSQKSRKRRK